MRDIQKEIYAALDGKLSMAHAGELARSAILPDVAKLRGYMTLERTSDRKGVSVLTLGFGFKDYQAERLPGYVLPRFNVEGVQDGAQFKPDDAESRKHGKDRPIKYETPDGARLILDVNPICQPDLGNPNKPKWITEGIKKGDAIASAGYCAIALQGVDCWQGKNDDGGRTALPDWRSISKEGTFYICFDSDAATKPEVRRAEKALADWLKARAGGSGKVTVLICRIPPKPDGAKQGIDDYLAAGGTLDEVALTAVPSGELATIADAAMSTVETAASMSELEYQQRRKEMAADLGINVRALDAERSKARARRRQPKDRIEIDADSHDLAANTEATFRAIKKDNDPPYLFIKGSPSTIVRLAEPDAAVKIDSPMAEILTVRTMRAVMVRVANWVRKEGTLPGKPHKDQVEDVLDALNKPLPPLRLITSVPIFLEDGTIIDTPGYTSGVLYVPAAGLAVLPVSDVPSMEEVMRAREWLNELVGLAPDDPDSADTVGKFPFVHHSDRAHAIALAFQHFVREMIDGPTPIYGFEADKPRTGKGLLFESLLQIGCGLNIAHYGPPPDDEEMQKKITSSALSQRASIIFDNAKENKYIDSAELASATTAWPLYSGRILSRSIDASLQLLNSWVISVNNPFYSNEIQGRTVRIRLVSNSEHPEDREFKHDFSAWFKEHWGDLVWAILTLTQNWIKKGKPAFSGKPLGRYEQWSRVLGGILEHSGIDGFLTLRPSDVSDATDDEGARFAEFLGKWWLQFKDSEKNIDELLPLAKEVTGFWLGRSGEDTGAVRSLGKTLRGKRDGTFTPMGTDASVRITFTGSNRKQGGWKLVPAMVEAKPFTIWQMESLAEAANDPEMLALIEKLKSIAFIQTDTKTGEAVPMRVKVDQSVIASGLVSFVRYAPKLIEKVVETKRSTAPGAALERMKVERDQRYAERDKRLASYKLDWDVALAIARQRDPSCRSCDWEKNDPRQPGYQGNAHCGSPKCEPKRPTKFNCEPDMKQPPIPDSQSISAGGKRAHCGCEACGGRVSGLDDALIVAASEWAEERDRLAAANAALEEPRTTVELPDADFDAAFGKVSEPATNPTGDDTGETY